MKNTAFIFSGQGSQYVGMGKNLYNKYKVVSDIFEEASDVLHMNMKKMLFEGDLATLTDTKNAQPAILTVGYAAYQAFIEKYGVIPNVLAGHSLGEITALTASNAIIFSDALHIVKKRGELMQEASHKTKGGMLSIYNVDIQTLLSICNEVSKGSKKVVISNYNSISQTVLSGDVQSIEEVQKIIEKEGGIAIKLNVSGAFHSPLMADAADEFKRYLKSFVYREIMIPVISNIDAQIYENEYLIEEKLTSQLTYPVLWTKVIEKIKSTKVDYIVESGPKEVLVKMLKRDNIGIECFSFEKDTDFILK